MRCSTTSLILKEIAGNFVVGITANVVVVVNVRKTLKRGLQMRKIRYAIIICIITLITVALPVYADENDDKRWVYNGQVYMNADLAIESIMLAKGCDRDTARAILKRDGVLDPTYETITNRVSRIYHKKYAGKEYFAIGPHWLTMYDEESAYNEAHSGRFPMVNDVREYIREYVRYNHSSSEYAQFYFYDDSLKIDDYNEMYELTSLEKIQAVNGCIDMWEDAWIKDIQVCDVGAGYYWARFKPTFNHAVSKLPNSTDSNALNYAYTACENIVNADFLEVGLINSGTDYEKMRKAYDYLVQNIERVGNDVEFSRYSEPCDVASLSKGTHEGFAATFQLMMESMGVECHYVYTRDYGAWNLVKMDGEYYFIDAYRGVDDPDKFFLFGTQNAVNPSDYPVSAVAYSEKDKPTEAETSATEEAIVESTDKEDVSEDIEDTQSTEAGTENSDGMQGENTIDMFKIILLVICILSLIIIISIPIVVIRRNKRNKEL